MRPDTSSGVTEATRPRMTQVRTTDRAIDRALVAKAAAVVVAGGWVGYLLFTGMPQLSLHVFPRTLALHLMFAGLAAVYAGWLVGARRLPGGSPLDLPVLALLAAYGIATVASVAWRVSVEPLLFLTAAVLVFYALSDLPLLSARSLSNMLMLLGLALSLYTLWVVGNDYADYLRLVRRVEGLSGSNIFPPTVPRAHDVSDHPNVLAMVLVLIVPFFTMAALRGETVWERGLGHAGLPVTAMALFLTLSRGAWIGATAAGLLAAIGVALTLTAYEREKQGFRPSWDNAIPRNVSPTALVAVVGALALAVVAGLAALASASTRPGWLFRGSLSPREDAWEAALDMFADYPLAGVGPHAFGLLYPQYSGEFLVHTQHAHNGFLQVAVDAGVIGLLALAALGVVTAWMLLRTWGEGVIGQRLLAVACASGLAGFALHNQLDAGNMWKAPPIALAVVGAIIVRNYRERALPSAAAVAPTGVMSRIPTRVPHYGRIAVRAALAVVMLLPFIGWYRIDPAHHDYYLGADAYNRGDLLTAADELRDAVDADSSVMVHRMLLGMAQARLFDAAGRQDRVLIEGAVVNLEQAVRIDPRSDIARANLARAYQLAGRPEEAAREAQITRLARNHVAPVLAVAEVYELLGREEDAVATYAQVISMDASLADSAFWDGTPWRRAHYDEIVGASILSVNPCTYGAHIVQVRRHDPTFGTEDLRGANRACELLVFTAPNELTQRVALGRIKMELGDMDAAFAHLRASADRQPDFAPARRELGRWYALSGNVDAARSEWVRAVDLGDAEAVMLLGGTYPADDRPAGLDDRLEELLATSSSSVQNDVVSILYYRIRWGRMSPVWAMIPGEWQTATPRIYDDMRSTLVRWQSEAP